MKKILLSLLLVPFLLNGAEEKGGFKFIFDQDFSAHCLKHGQERAEFLAVVNLLSQQRDNLRNKQGAMIFLDGLIFSNRDGSLKVDTIIKKGSHIRKHMVAAQMSKLSEVGSLENYPMHFVVKEEFERRQVEAQELPHQAGFIYNN